MSLSYLHSASSIMTKRDFFTLGWCSSFLYFLSPLSTSVAVGERPPEGLIFSNSFLCPLQRREVQHLAFIVHAPVVEVDAGLGRATLCCVTASRAVVVCLYDERWASDSSRSLSFTEQKDTFNLRCLGTVCTSGQNAMNISVWMWLLLA